MNDTERKVEHPESDPAPEGSVGIQVATGDSGRRALLTAISAAGVAGAAKLPGQWPRPVVDYAILPVHAQTTTEEPASSITTTCVITCEDRFYILLTSVTFDPTLYTVTGETGNYTLCSDEFGGVTQASSAVATFNTVIPTSCFSTSSSTCSFSTFNENGLCTMIPS